MPKIFNVVDPVGNQILIYDEISKSFVNRDQQDLIKDNDTITAIKRLDPEGFQVFNTLVNGIASFRSLRGGNQIKLKNMESYIEIEFDGNADTLGGKTPESFLEVENNLSEINPIIARSNLDVYSKEESHDRFMEINSSNIPDEDNTYDLGSTNKKYSNIYAYNFHGTINRALLAEELSSYGASDGDYLAWSNTDNGWRPITPESFGMEDIEDVFLKVENNLSDINPIIARSNLDVYSKGESHDRFMETNSSNIPDKDNTYDLGSNGRRYADIFAVTFHGTATRALMADGFRSHGASDGDYLAWSAFDNGWRPIKPPKVAIKDISDVENKSPSHGEILQFNSNNNRWEFTEYVPFTGTADNAITSLQTSGNGVSTVRSRTGNIVELRSIRGAEGVNVTTANFENEIIIDVDLPESTDHLKEGNDNLYYTDERVTSVLNSSSLSELKDVTNEEPVNNKGLIWENGNWRLKDVLHSIYSTDGIAEGDNNLYHTDSRVNTLIDSYISNGNLSIGDLSNVNTTTTSKTWLYFNGLNWVNRSITTDLVSEGNDNLYHTDSRVNTLIDSYISNGNLSIDDLSNVNTTTTSKTWLYFNGQDWVNKSITTDLVSEGNDNLYYTDERVENAINSFISNVELNDISNVKVDSAQEGDVLQFKNNEWGAVNFDTPVFKHYRVKSTETNETININDAAVHRIDGTTDKSLSIVGDTNSNEAINIVIFIEGYGGNITWPEEIHWSNNSEPSLGANWTNIVLFWTGSMWIGMLSARS